jgi:hypothetical protein
VDSFTATVEKLPGHGLLVRLTLHADVGAGGGAAALRRSGGLWIGAVDLDLRVTFETLETRLFQDATSGMRVTGVPDHRPWF